MEEGKEKKDVVVLLRHKDGRGQQNEGEIPFPSAPLRFFLTSSSSLAIIITSSPKS